MAAEYTWVEGEDDTAAHKTAFFTACGEKMDAGYTPQGGPYKPGGTKVTQTFIKVGGGDIIIPQAMRRTKPKGKRKRT